MDRRRSRGRSGAAVEVQRVDAEAARLPWRNSITSRTRLRSLDAATSLPCSCAIEAKLGALAGAQTVTAAMAAVQERLGSPVAVLGYTRTYAVANILLTIGGATAVLVVAT